MEILFIKVLNDLVLLQLISFLTLIFFLNSVNPYVLWYLGGLYMLIVGFYALTDDADIFIGFLWVIDLGVGLIFFIFIMHFSNFLHQKPILALNERYFYFYCYLFIFFIFFSFFFAFPNFSSNFRIADKLWNFCVSWYNYYNVLDFRQITELQLLRQIYFSWSGLNFFLINFSIFYALISIIIFVFLIKKFFITLSLPELVNYSTLSTINSYFFIRQQNFIKQQNTVAGAKVWIKKKILNYDF